MCDNGRRLIEDYLPIQAISAEASREKSVRKGHISTLHLWWARRPLAACRAAVYGALVPASRFIPPACRAGHGAGRKWHWNSRWSHAVLRSLALHLQGRRDGRGRGHRFYLRPARGAGPACRARHGAGRRAEGPYNWT